MDCTVKGNLPSEIFEDIIKIADNRINFQQLKNKTVFVSDCHGLIAYYIISKRNKNYKRFKALRKLLKVFLSVQ